MKRAKKKGEKNNEKAAFKITFFPSRPYVALGTFNRQYLIIFDI